MSEPAETITITLQQLADALLNTSAGTLATWEKLNETGKPGRKAGEVTRWHCYTLAYESIYSADVDAAGPNEAAVMAAEQTGKDGTWTVVDGSAVQVQLTEKHIYEVTKHIYEVTGFAPDVRTGPPRTVPVSQMSAGQLINEAAEHGAASPQVRVNLGSYVHTAGLGAPIKDGPPPGYTEAGDSSAPLLLGGDVVSRSDWLDSLKVWVSPENMFVGKGGPGPDPTIPVCPVCGSYGGGGHGGGCPNSGKPLLDWVKLAS
jgi:hypothetical protein